MSLPHATQSQIDAMNRIAEQKMQQDGIAHEPTQSEPIMQKNPMLQHHEEPVYQEEQPEVEEYEEEEEQAPIAQQVIQQESSQQMNFRLIRERAERAERERDEAMKYAMSFNQPKPQVQAKEQEEDYLSGFDLDHDGLAEGKHLKMLRKEISDLKKEMSSYKQQTNEDTTRIKLTTQFTDYDKVMSKSNLDALESANPELAEMISNTPDMYKRAKLAYEMVKQYGIYKDTSYDQEKAIAQTNAKKPRPLTSASPQQGDTPLSKANAFANGSLSDQMKAQYRREMIEATKGR